MTPTEKATKAIDEGFQWLLAFVAMRLGEEKSPSYELRGAAQEARRAAWQAMSAYGRFKALANGERPSDEHQLDIPGTVSVTVPEPSPRVVALVDAIDKAVDKAIADTFGDIPDEPPVDQELDNAQQALDEQLAELGCMDDAVDATVERDLEDHAKLYAEVGHDDEDDAKRWAVCREYQRVLAALKGLAPGAGPEAVRACLCGLAEQMNGEVGSEAPVDGEVGVGPEDGQVEAEAEAVVDLEAVAQEMNEAVESLPVDACTCGLVGTCDRCVELDRREAEAEHAALRALNPPAEGEPKHGLSEGEARSIPIGSIVLIHWPGAANGTNARRGKVDHVNKDGSKVFVCMERTGTAGEYLGEFGSVRAFPCGEVLEVVDKPGPTLINPPAAPDLPGRPAGEPAKRRKAKAKPEQAAAAYYDEPGRKFTGD